MFKSILVPIDVEAPKESLQIVKAASALSADWQATLHVAAIVPDVGMSIVGSYFEDGFEKKSLAEAKRRLETLLGNAGISATTHIQIGKVYDQVIALAQKLDTDLIVIGAHSPDVKDYLLGSNAARIVRHSKKSVLVLRIGLQEE